MYVLSSYSYFDTIVRKRLKKYKMHFCLRNENDSVVSSEINVEPSEPFFFFISYLERKKIFTKSEQSLANPFFFLFFISTLSSLPPVLFFLLNIDVALKKVEGNEPRKRSRTVETDTIERTIVQKEKKNEEGRLRERVV